MYGATDHYKIEDELKRLGFFDKETNGPTIYHPKRNILYLSTPYGYTAHTYKYLSDSGRFLSKFTILIRNEY